MAWMNQEKKSEIAPAVKSILKQHGAKGSLSVRHNSTLVLTITESPFDIGDHASINPYHFREFYKDDPEFVEFVGKLHDAMMVGNWDKSDIMTDYFNVGWYVEIRFGKWNKPHVCNK